MHIFIKTRESGFEWILRDGSVTHADLESANEAELIFWNKEDRRRAPVRGDPRWRRCYVLIISHQTHCVSGQISWECWQISYYSNDGIDSNYWVAEASPSKEKG